MHFMDHIAILLVVFFTNWGINSWYNSTNKNKDGKDITMMTTSMQSLISTIIAVFIIFILSMFLLKSEA
jgi:uncharacterized membrane protein YidH (DUF202 family)